MSSPSPGRTVDVLRDFQAVMDQFLDLQRAMLPAYLGTVRQEAPVPAEVAPLSEDSGAVLVEAPDPVTCGRYRIVVVDRPLSGVRSPLPRDCVIVITDDGRGVAEAVSDQLFRSGYRTAIVSTAAEAAAVAQQQGRVGALLHLMPLSAPSSDAVEEEALIEPTRTLFLLAQALGADLARSARDGGAAVIACTSLGGLLGHGPQAPLNPEQAGVLGFTKCLALEWPDVRVRAVDLDTSAAAATLAGHVLDELWASDPAPEVGYASGRRVGLDVVAAPASVEPGFALPSDAVILATGGARGITADVCLELAERCQPTFVLVGQSPLPAPLESADTANLTAPADLKRALMQRLQAAGERVTPAAIEQAYRQLEKDREIRRNVGALSAAGARVHYVTLDVRDAAGLAALVDDIYDTYGRLDGVIHGAGVIEDKLIRDKPLDSFERVFATKAVSAFVLARRLRRASLRFLVFFSSVAGRFGNRGQADYAAANEVVSTLAGALNRQWPGRICAIAWAPWDKRGMVSPELKREFARRGVELVSPEAGRRACWTEIQQAPAADAQIVVGGAVPAAIATAAAIAAPAADTGGRLPLLAGARRENAGPDAVRFHRLLDVSVDRYLDDHRLDGRPVLPLAVATELMAEAAQATVPDLTVVAVRDLQLFKGIVLEDAPVPLVVTVRPAADPARDGMTEVVAEIATPTLTPVMRYRASVQLAARLPDPPSFERPTGTLEPLPIPLHRAYREWTFHGPLFQRLTQIAGLAAGAIVGSIFSSSAVPVVAGAARPAWIIDPFVFDAALQLQLIWSRARNGMTALPSRFREFRRYGDLSDRRLTCYVAVGSSAGGHALRNDIHFLDAAGQVVATLDGMEASCTAALNRLAARDTCCAAGGR